MPNRPRKTEPSPRKAALVKKSITPEHSRALDRIMNATRPSAVRPFAPSSAPEPPDMKQPKRNGKHSTPAELCKKAEARAKPFAQLQQTWDNWGIIDINTTTGGRLFTPKMVHPRGPHDIAKAIRDAEAAGTTIRALGSGWSFSDAVLPQITPVPITEVVLEKLEVVTGTATPPKVARMLEKNFGRGLDTTGYASSLQEHLSSLLLDGVDATQLFFVEAGIKLSDLNALLDHQRPRLALKTLGGSAGQSLAGAISTGTHGGDFDRAPIADSVRAIYLIASGGTHHWIEPKKPITDPAKIQALFPCIRLENIHFDDEMFRAALVSMGAMGVIYALIIDVVRQFSLVQWNRWRTWGQLTKEAGPTLGRAVDGSWSGINDFLSAHFKKNQSPNQFLQVVINPIPNNNGSNNCYVTNRVQVPLQLVPSGPTPKDLSTLSKDDLINAIKACPEMNNLGSIVAFGFANISGSTIIDQARSLINFCKSYGYFWAIRAVIGFILQESFPASNVIEVFGGLPPDAQRHTRQHAAPGPRVDVGFEIMTGGVFGGAKLPVVSMEAAFEFSKAILFIDLMLQQFNLIGVAQNKYPAGYISLRATGQTDALLGMQQFKRTGHVEISLLDTSDDEGWVETAEKVALGLGGILHWGQSNGRMTAADVKKRFGSSLANWNEVRKKLNGNSTTFVNTFMKRLGLV